MKFRYEEFYAEQSRTLSINPWTKRLRGILRRNRSNGKRRLLTLEETAERLGVAKNTLYDWCAVRKIPHIKMGKFLRFDGVEVDAWLKEKRVMTKDA